MDRQIQEGNWPGTEGNQWTVTHSINLIEVKCRRLRVYFTLGTQAMQHFQSDECYSCIYW